MIHGLHHVSMKSKNDEEYAKAREFYSELLGFGIVKECESCALFDTGAGFIEIFRSGTETTADGAVRHFALSVDDPDELVEKARGFGCEIIVEPKDIFLGDDEDLPARIAFCRGVLGEKIEFFLQKW